MPWRKELILYDCSVLGEIVINATLTMAEEEVLALQGIFCGEGEFEILENSGGEWTFILSVSCQVWDQEIDLSQDSLKISLQCLLPSGYPNELPTVSLACGSLTKHSANRLREELHEYAKSLRGQPMIMELVYWVQENARNFMTPLMRSSQENPEDPSKPYVAVLHIDHMRSRTRYTKTLASWALELSLTGRLAFVHHLILVLLMGREDCVKDFLVRLRTQKVDVDSSGRSCKERMMSVLMQGSHPRPSGKRLMSDFRVLDGLSPTDLERVFDESDLEGVYKETVAPKFNMLQSPADKTVGKS